jgi:hypothetical protein
MIRKNGDVRRVRSSEHAGEHENIFLAKIRDSESAIGAVNYVALLARAFIARSMRRA